jgi:hypothetical protein
MNRTQTTAIGTLVVSAVACWASISGSSAGGYEFPTVIALTMALLALGMAVPAFGRGRAMPAEDDGGSVPWGRVWPGLVFFVGYLLVLERLGFFVSSLIAFVGLTLIYAPGTPSLSALLKQIGIGLGFIAVLYAVFVLLLQVQFPRGLLF